MPNIKIIETNNFGVIYTDDSQRWNNILREFPDADTYYTQGYVKTFMAHGDGIPVLIYYNSSKLKAINVAMVRMIKDIEDINISSDCNWLDLSTPYGYGGFMFNKPVEYTEVHEFNNDYCSFCEKNNIVSEFVRFHPVNRNYLCLDNVYEIICLGNTVELDLESDEKIWENITSKNRNVIRKAVKNGVEIKYGFTRELLEEFRIMYNATMDRDNAKQYYYFDKEFYETLYIECKDDAKVFFAEYKGKKISMAIILMRNKQMHYHLSASDYEYRSLAPTNMLLWEVAKWGRRQGCSSFHLGGGVGGDINDSLYKFKKSFNRNAACKFYIGKKIFDSKKYDSLCQNVKHGIQLNESFFPVYRSGLGER